LTHAVLRIRRRLVDRRGNGAGQFVRFSARVDRKGVYAVPILWGIAIVHRGIMASGRSGRDRPPVEVEHQLLAIDVVDLDTDLVETEFPDRGQ
jgi:hypothetical protein